jgi:hypothetical protein
MTTALPTTTSMSEIFASADQNAILTLLANKAVERAMSSKLEDARDAVVNKLVDILKVYKDTMTSAGGGASAQLAIPENLKLLPLLCCGLVKHVSLVVVIGVWIFTESLVRAAGRSSRKHTNPPGSSCICTRIAHHVADTIAPRLPSSAVL